MYGYGPLLSLSRRGAGSNWPLRPLNQSQLPLLYPPFVCLAIGFGLSRGAKYLLSAHFPSLASAANVAPGRRLAVDPPTGPS
jgi:hypothetical protein